MISKNVFCRGSPVVASIVMRDISGVTGAAADGLDGMPVLKQVADMGMA